MVEILNEIILDRRFFLEKVNGLSYPCTNKPKNSVYFENAVKTPFCPYKCDSSNFDSNLKCTEDSEVTSEIGI